MEQPDLTTINSYMKYIRDNYPEIEDIVETFSTLGFTQHSIHKYVKNMYDTNNFSISKKYKTPKDIVIKKINDIFFDETCKRYDTFSAKYSGNGTYYNHDMGSLTKQLTSKSFSEFLENIGFDEATVICINSIYADNKLDPEEYPICMLHYIINLLYPNTLKQFDNHNIIAWGHKNLNKYFDINDYLLNFIQLKKFITTEDNVNYVKEIINIMINQFPNSQVLEILKSLITTGFISDNSPYATTYNELEETPLNKCRKFITHSVTMKNN